MLLATAGTDNVVGLDDGSEAECQEFRNRVPDQLRLIPVETVLAIRMVAPSASEDHASSVAGLFTAVETFVLTAVEDGCSTRTLPVHVEAVVVICSRASAAADDLAASPADLAMLKPIVSVADQKSFIVIEQRVCSHLG